mgnify:FL=1
MVTEAIRSRMVWVITGVLALLVLLALPAKAESADYETTLDRLGRLQALAEQYIEEKNSGDDPIDLTLSFTRVGDYNTTIWQLTAGTRDGEFEKYATDADPDLWDLQGMNTVELPNGQGIDFGHLLAAMNLVYRGMPITGSWGGDCMQLAQVYAGQASDADGYASLMQQTFAIEDDGSVSKFGDQDLRADLDSVVAGAELKSGSNVADVLRNYYTNLTDYDRCYQFIAMSFGSMNTSDSEAFRNKVYSTMTADAGMQLLLYMNGMWSSSGWQVDADAEPALRGACNELADYLSRAVNGEKVKSASSTLMHTMAGQALVDALNALGDGEAASAAQSALEADSGATISTSSGDAVDDALNTATEKLKTDFNAQAFELGLLVLGAAALLGMVVALMRMSRLKILRTAFNVYVEILRGTPILLQLYFFWIGLPKLVPFELTDTQCIVAALVVNASAFISEIIRAGIGAVDKGQWEAARSIGLSETHVMTRIILPQAVKNILPALCNEFISTVKGTSLASVFFVGELMTSFKTVQSATFLALQSLTIVGIIYFLLNFILSRLLRVIERRLTVSD